MAFRVPLRSMATSARQSLKIGMIPADGIGREVLPVRRASIVPCLFPYPRPGRKSCYSSAGVVDTQDRIHRPTGWLRIFHENGHGFAQRDC
ncbi:hypothetical protein F5I97DRAFT_935153 [Phlebopus sp. FC_14]|nr:hypothetical protein F5I97DRAFT_935153 [Phlebopus sp. FC_14]